MIRSICARLNVTLEELRDPSRSKTVTAKRQVACWELRRSSRLSYLEIGEILHRSRTPTRHACARVDAALAAGDPMITRLVGLL